MSETIGLYLHIPFCKKKCFYCDFYSVTDYDEIVDEYIDALITEIKAQSILTREKKVGSIFFGGGTPSLLSPAQVEKVINALNKSMKLLPNAEVTLEMNPESVTKENAQNYLFAGVNRASIGIQSLYDDKLKFLQRIHTADDAQKSYSVLAAAGFKNISVDLIYGLPDETMKQWTAQLREVASWIPAHISCYELTPEPDTGLYNSIAKEEIKIDKEKGTEFYEACEAILESFHYRHYEVSNYARPGFECVHNIGYWHNRDYLGIGAAAHSLMEGVRWWNFKSVERYISTIKSTGGAVAEKESLSPQNVQTERLMMGLRLAAGIAFSENEITEKIKTQIDAGFLEHTGGHLRATRDSGFRLLDSVLVEI